MRGKRFWRVSSARIEKITASETAVAGAVAAWIRLEPELPEFAEPPEREEKNAASAPMRLAAVEGDAPNCVPPVVVVWNVTLNGTAVPATTGKVSVLASGRLTLVPAEIPQVVGVPALPTGAEGRLVGQFSVTEPLNVLSGTICN